MTKIREQPKSTTAKVWKICRQYPNESRETPAGNLRRMSQIRQKNFCGESTKIRGGQAKLVTTSSSHGEQTYIQLDRANFMEKVVSAFLAADTPLHKLNHSALKSLFVAMGKLLLSETAARARVAQLASQKENIRELLRHKKVFLIVDEAEVD